MTISNPILDSSSFAEVMTSVYGKDKYENMRPSRNDPYNIGLSFLAKQVESKPKKHSVLTHGKVKSSTLS